MTDTRREMTRAQFDGAASFAYEHPRIEDASTDDLDDRPVGPAADAFDDWFYRDETKAASITFIGDYIVRHRDDLCRLSD